MPVQIKKTDRDGNERVKVYETVAERVARGYEGAAEWPLGRITTEIIFVNEDKVIMKAFVYDEKGELRGTGHGEEYRGTSDVNRTSAMENAETSAVGRALFAAGKGSGEFCTAEDLANALKRQAQLKDAVVAAAEGRLPAPDQRGDGQQAPAFRPRAGDEGVSTIPGLSEERRTGSDGNEYVLVVGNTYNHKRSLRRLGFDFNNDLSVKLFGERGRWFKLVQQAQEDGQKEAA